MKQLLFVGRNFSEYLVVSSSFFFQETTPWVTNTVSDQLLFEDKYFFCTTAVRSNFSRISNYSEHLLFRSRYFFEHLLFQKKNYFSSRYFLKTVTFLIILRNKFHSIYTWKDSSLTSIHSFKYTMVWSDFEILQSFIVQNSKKRINFNTGCVTNVTF